jgi:kexin
MNALILEANPKLTWQVVQGIMATTSHPVNTDPDDDIGVTNAAGLWHSNLYGFGIINAAAAIQAAERWELYGPEKLLIGKSGSMSIPILEDATVNISSKVTIASTGGEYKSEAVDICLDILHIARGHLEVVLTSSQGTSSVPLPGNSPESTQLDEGESWKLLTVRH